ncbi:MAG: hypothetical protein GXO29_05160 [Thermotogae bacterium]|nr:hypothetical protein [Thermotogota bacterium]
MKKVGNFDSLLTAIRASANVGGNFLWEFKVKAGSLEGRIITQGEMILYAEYGGKRGLDALMELQNYDVLTYEVNIYTGDIPELHNIKLRDLETLDVKAEYEDVEPVVVERIFYDFLVEMEDKETTALAIFPSREGRPVMAGFIDGRLVGLRTPEETFSTVELLDELRTYRTRFHILEGEFVPYMSGYFTLTKSAIDTPAGSWTTERIISHEGTLVSFGVGDRIIAVSDGHNLLIVFRPVVPPQITSKLLKEFQKKGRLVDAYPVIEIEPIFRYSFKDIKEIRRTFDALIKESRKLVGEIIFNMASDRVLNFAHPTNPYPDEYAEFTKNVYKQYEDEIAAFTGKRWKEIKASVLKDAPEHVIELFGS